MQYSIENEATLKLDLKMLKTRAGTRRDSDLVLGIELIAFEYCGKQVVNGADYIQYIVSLNKSNSQKYNLLKTAGLHESANQLFPINGNSKRGVEIRMELFELLGNVLIPKPIEFNDYNRLRYFSLNKELPFDYMHEWFKRARVLCEFELINMVTNPRRGLTKVYHAEYLFRNSLDSLIIDGISDIRNKIALSENFDSWSYARVSDYVNKALPIYAKKD